MYVRHIERDKERFRQIVRGSIRKELRKYMTQGEMIGKKGKDLVSIPVPQIHIPRFVYDPKKTGGVGQGEGEQGTPIGHGDGKGDEGGAGNMPGYHILEVDITLEELASILGEELELPRIEPRGKENVVAEKAKYTGIRRAGPESFRHFKRTYKEALKRLISSGEYDFDDPIVIPVKEDKRYRARRPIVREETSAVIFYMLDVSGSLSDEQKEIVRILAFWLDVWIRARYKGVAVRYIVHDTEAREVDEHTFYHTRESGGTYISSAYELCAAMIDKEYDIGNWNVYAFHFSDGDNWDNDNQKALDLVEKHLLKKCNMMGYGNVATRYATSSTFHKSMATLAASVPNLTVVEIADRDHIYDAVKVFLGKGV